ncbi:hypothetical protein FWC31_00190 [Candidatus Saccharibacteria bacterium]|nr:hypothetical protein [Candidatus Saccharibacteria bacterium]
MVSPNTPTPPRNKYEAFLEVPEIANFINFYSKKFDLPVDLSTKQGCDEFVTSIYPQLRIHKGFPATEGARRDDAEQATAEWSNEEERTIIYAATEVLGINNKETSLTGEHEIVVALPGAYQANLDRPNFVINAIKNGEAEIKLLIFVGSKRKLSDAERAKIENYAPGTQTEFDAVKATFEKLSAENPGISMRLIEIKNDQEHTASIVDKVASELDVDGENMTFVTTEIYRLTTEIDVLRGLSGHNVLEKFVAGNPSDQTRVEQRANNPNEYYQEILKWLRSLANYKKELPWLFWSS